MDCKAVFKLDFGDSSLAKKALDCLGGPKESTPRALVLRSVNKDALEVVITASDFTALRAHSTSTLRDAKVFVDACKIVGATKAGKTPRSTL